jgi:hypothetical protein
MLLMSTDWMLGTAQHDITDQRCQHDVKMDGRGQNSSFFPESLAEGRPIAIFQQK